MKKYLKIFLIVIGVSILAGLVVTHEESPKKLERFTSETRGRYEATFTVLMPEHSDSCTVIQDCTHDNEIAVGDTVIQAVLLEAWVKGWTANNGIRWKQLIANKPPPKGHVLKTFKAVVRSIDHVDLPRY